MAKKKVSKKKNKEAIRSYYLIMICLGVVLILGIIYYYFINMFTF